MFVISNSVNFSLFLFSLAIIVGASWYFLVKWKNVTLFDLYVLMTGFYFGATTLLNSLLNNLEGYSGVKALGVHVHVILVLAFTGLLLWLTSSDLTRTLEIRRIIHRLDGITPILSLPILVTPILLKIYFYWTFGIISYADPRELKYLNVSFPYWASSLSMILPYLLLVAFLLTTVKLFVSKDNSRLYWLTGFFILICLQGFYGRRAIFAFMIVFYLVLFFTKDIKPLSIKGIALLCLGIPFFVGFSNFYQELRGPLLAFRPDIGHFWRENVDKSDLLEAEIRVKRVNNLAVNLGEKGEHEKAIEAAKSAVLLSRKLVQVEKDQYNKELDVSLRNLAILLKKEGLNQEAKALEEEADSLKPPQFSISGKIEVAKEDSAPHSNLAPPSIPEAQQPSDMTLKSIPLIDTSPNTLRGILLTPLRVKKSLHNLSHRTPYWHLNYQVADAQIRNKQYTGLGGELTRQGFINSIPKLFWPQKKWGSLERMVEHAYDLEEFDKPSNDFAMTQADFGFFSLLLLPLLYWGIFASFAFIFVVFSRHPVLLLLTLGLLLQFILNVERYYGDWILLYRTLGLVLILYFSLYVPFGLYRRFVN